MADPAAALPPRDEGPGSGLLPLDIEAQPTDSTCGPTCLHAVLRFHGDTVSLDELIRTTPTVTGEETGTLAVMLGLVALERGYDALLHTFNLQVFDPTWFAEDGRSDPDLLREKLSAQAAAKRLDDPRFEVATRAYQSFLGHGGRIRLTDPTPRLITHCLRHRHPILTGLSATYLYRCAREWEAIDDHDDVHGVATGHFVVVHGYDARTRRVTIADPLADNPGFSRQNYAVPIDRLVAAILLGVLTYDANLLIIRPRKVRA